MRLRGLGFIMVILATFVLVDGCSAKYKVVKTSYSKVPDWFDKAIEGRHFDKAKYRGQEGVFIYPIAIYEDTKVSIDVARAEVSINTVEILTKSKSKYKSQLKDISLTGIVPLEEFSGIVMIDGKEYFVLAQKRFVFKHTLESIEEQLR